MTSRRILRSVCRLTDVSLGDGDRHGIRPVIDADVQCTSDHWYAVCAWRLPSMPPTADGSAPTQRGCERDTRRIRVIRAADGVTRPDR